MILTWSYQYIIELLFWKIHRFKKLDIDLEKALKYDWKQLCEFWDQCHKWDMISRLYLHTEEQSLVVSIKIMCLNGVTCLPTICCFSELALKKPTKGAWLVQNGHHHLIEKNVACSCQSWLSIKQQSLVHSSLSLAGKNLSTCSHLYSHLSFMGTFWHYNLKTKIYTCIYIIGLRTVLNSVLRLQDVIGEITSNFGKNKMFTIWKLNVDPC